MSVRCRGRPGSMPATHGTGIGRAGDPARRGPSGGVRPLGRRVHRQRTLHSGLPVRRQPALHAGDGTACQATARPGRDRRRDRLHALHRHDDRRARAVPPATAARSAGALSPRRGHRRSAGRGVLHRLQPAEDAAHRAAVLRHHGRARHPLPGDGRTVALLRRAAVPCRRSGDLGPHRLPHGRAPCERRQSRAVLVPDLPGATGRGGRSGQDGHEAGPGAVPAVPGRAARRAAPAAEAPGEQARRTARAPRRAGRERRRARHPAGDPGPRLRRPASSRGSAGCATR